MEISAKMVKDLREMTGAGMMDCKKALIEADGDMDAAVDLLRTKGLAALSKKAGRATNEGVIGGFVDCDARVGALVEVNCETDFVARNADFRNFVASVAEHVATAAPADVSELMGQNFAGRNETFEQVLGETVARIGENMGVARLARYELSSADGAVTVYIHGVGNIGVMVELSASSSDAADSPAFLLLAKDIAMQIAAASPMCVDRDGIDADVVARELEIYKAQAAESGKPEQIQDKIAQGRLEKFYKEVVLLEQPFVKDSDLTVTQQVDKVAKELGAQIGIVRFERFVLGETATAQ